MIVKVFHTVPHTFSTLCIVLFIFDHVDFALLFELYWMFYSSSLLGLARCLSAERYKAAGKTTKGFDFVKWSTFSLPLPCFYLLVGQSFLLEFAKLWGKTGHGQTVKFCCRPK